MKTFSAETFLVVFLFSIEPFLNVNENFYFIIWFLYICSTILVLSIFHCTKCHQLILNRNCNCHFFERFFQCVVKKIKIHSFICFYSWRATSIRTHLTSAAFVWRGNPTSSCPARTHTVYPASNSGTWITRPAQVTKYEI